MFLDTTLHYATHYIRSARAAPVRTQPLAIILTRNIQQIRKCQQSVTLLAHSLCCFRVVLNWRLFARRTLTIRVFEILQVTLYTTDVISLRTLTTYFIIDHKQYLVNGAMLYFACVTTRLTADHAQLLRYDGQIFIGPSSYLTENTVCPTYRSQ